MQTVTGWCVCDKTEHGLKEHRGEGMGLGWGEPKISDLGGFPGSPLVKTTPSNAEGGGSVPGRGAKIPHADRKSVV